MKKVLIVCGVLTVLGLGGCLGPSTELPSTVDVGNANNSSNDKSIDQGSYAEAGNRAVMVTGVKRLKAISIEFVDSLPGPILWVDTKFKNTGNESGNFMFSEFKLIDTQGREYAEISDAVYLLFREELGLPNRVNDYYPGEEKVEAIGFRVAPDAEPTHIEWKGLQLKLE